jgi:acetate kinase
MEKLARKDDLILVLNSGSSSLKFGVYFRGANDEAPLLTGSAAGIGRDNGTLHIRSSSGERLLQRDGILESQIDALAAIAAAIREHIHASPVAVGHRVVHGGPKLRTHQLITPQVMDELRSATHFAPLHIPQALSLIASAQSIFPEAKHFACFDDAFHRTIPEVSSHLPLPQRYYDAGIRRYGFHGLSYESLVHHFGDQLPERAIFAHLGNGSSLCALRDGVSIDTTMGLTPTGGIPMGTRCGDLDPGVFLYLLRTEKLDADQLEDMLNHQSGLLALSAGESDVKTLEERVRCNDLRAALALDVSSVVWTFSFLRAASESTAITFGR